jgi:hypothetical protein
MREENNRNAAAARARWYKTLNWNVQVEKIERHFLDVAETAKKEKFFEVLFVDRDDEHRTVQLHAGKHPIGSSETIRDGFGRATGWRIDVEHGAALVISQSALGGVAVILYPYQSEKVQRVEPHVIWAIFKDPTAVTGAVLRAAVADFLTYVRVSSALFNESTMDRLRIRYLEYRGKKYKDGEGGGVVSFIFSHWLWIFLGAAGSVASIYSLWR